MPIAPPLRRAREGELPRSGKRSWPGPRLGAPNWPGPRPRRVKRCVHPVGARIARPGDCGLYRFAKLLIHNCVFAAMRRRHTRGGGTKVPPASCESPPLPSGRAARAKVSDAFRLPPGCHCNRQGIGCHPKTVRVPFTAPVGARTPRPHIGTRPERRLHGNNRRGPHIASTPAPGVRRKTEPPRRYRKSNFSTVCGQICLRSRALAGIPWRG